MFNKIKSIFVKSEPKPQYNEIAITESALYKGIGFRSYNPDQLVQRKSFAIYDEMRLDDEVKAALTLKKHAVIAPGWDIEPASEEDIDIEVAEFVEYSLGKMYGAINDALLQILSALDYGYSITEIIWKAFDSGEYVGKIGISALKPKKPHYYEFETDDYSNLKPNGLVQTGILLAQEKDLPINKFLIYSYQKEFSNWYGQSDLRSAYRSYWSKDNIIKFWNIYLERFGSPTAIGKYKTNNTSAISNLKTILSNLQNKTSITFREGEFDVSLLEPQRRSTAEYEAALNFHNKGIARSILIPDRLMAAGDTGAYSQAKIHFDVFLWVVQRLRQELEETVMQEQLIRRLVGWNYQDVNELPKFKFRPLTDDQKLELANAFSDAVQKGSVVPTLYDENHIRRILSFPEKEEIEEEVPATDTVGMPEDGETEEGEKRQMSYIQRGLTQYEKKVNFAEIDKTTTTQEVAITKELRTIIKEQRDSLIAFVSKKIATGQLTTQLIKTGIDLKYTKRITDLIKEMFVESYKQGKTDSKSELPKEFVVGKQGIAIVPDKILDYFAAKSNFVVNGIKQPLTNQTQMILLDAIRSGESIPKVIEKLQKAYQPYIETGDMIVDKKVLTSYRLETIIRTNYNEAYNYGRRAVGEDPDLKDYVIGYQFSEILDDRTVEISHYVDQKIIAIDNPALSDLAYPLHYNDRGMFVFVTKDELPVEFMSPAEINQAIILKGSF